MGRLWIEDKRFRLESGKVAKGIAPAIISASRVTDIPAHYCDWFFHRLRSGYMAVPIPGSRKLVHRYVSFANTQFLVFFSKNPLPLIAHIPYLKEKNIDFYINFTLNDYSGLGLEPGLNVEEPLQRRIDTFKRLSDTVGPERVVWHFDPLVYAPKIKIDTLMERISSIAEQLKGYTNRFMFGFLNVPQDSIVFSNLKAREIPFKYWTKALKLVMVQEIVKANKGWGFELATCSDSDSYRLLGVGQGKCVDYNLITRLAWRNSHLMDTINARIYTYDPQPSLFGEVDPVPDGAIMLDSSHYILPDDDLKKYSNTNAGENECRCNYSFDIGTPGSCTYKCAYCFAAEPSYILDANVKAHSENPKAPSLLGESDHQLRIAIETKPNPKGVLLDRSLKGLNSSRGYWEVKTNLAEDDPYYLLAKKVYYYADDISEKMIERVKALYPDPYAVLGIEPPKPSSSLEAQSVQRQKEPSSSGEVKERVFDANFKKNTCSFHNDKDKSVLSEIESQYIRGNIKGKTQKQTKPTNTKEGTKPSNAVKDKTSSEGNRTASPKEVPSASSVALQSPSIKGKDKDSCSQVSRVSFSTSEKASEKGKDSADNQSNDSNVISDFSESSQKTTVDTTSAISDEIGTSCATESSNNGNSSSALFETEDKESRFEYTKKYCEAIIDNDGEVIIDPDEECDSFARDILNETESEAEPNRPEAAQKAESLDAKASEKSSKKNNNSKTTSSKKDNASDIQPSEPTEGNDSSLNADDALRRVTHSNKEHNSIPASAIKEISSTNKDCSTAIKDSSTEMQASQTQTQSLPSNEEPSVKEVSYASTSPKSEVSGDKEGLKVKDIFFPVVESEMERGSKESVSSQDPTHKNPSTSESASKSEPDPTDVKAYLQMLRDSGKYTSEQQVMEAFIQKVNSMNLSGGDKLFNDSSKNTTAKNITAKKGRKRISSAIFSTAKDSDKGQVGNGGDPGKVSDSKAGADSVVGSSKDQAETAPQHGTGVENPMYQNNPYSFLNKTYPNEPIKYNPNSDEAGSAYVTDYVDIQQQITRAEEETISEAEYQKEQWLQSKVYTLLEDQSQSSGSEQQDVISDSNVSWDRSGSFDDDMGWSVGMNRNTLRNRMKKKK